MAGKKVHSGHRAAADDRRVGALGKRAPAVSHTLAAGIARLLAASQRPAPPVSPAPVPSVRARSLPAIDAILDSNLCDHECRAGLSGANDAPSRISGHDGRTRWRHPSAR
jgi:hypothetical protein